MLEFIGEGAYGKVIKAKDLVDNKIVAIKKIKDKDIDDAQLKKVIVREMKSLRVLNHPNLIKLLSVFRHNKKLYFVFPFFGCSLLDELEI